MARPRLPLGVLGTISVTEYPNGSGKYRALAHYRRANGTIAQIERTNTSKIKARLAVQHDFEKIKADLMMPSMSPTMRLSKLAELFIAEKKGRRSEGTIQVYQNVIDVHVIPKIGGLTILEITPEQASKFIGQVAKDSGHGAAKSCRSVLSGMMALAVRNGAISHNPVSEVEGIEKHKKPGSAPIPPEQLGAFLKAINANEKMQRRDLVDLFTLMAFTGLRMGEVCGLKWDAVDLEKGELTVCRQAKALRKQGVILQEWPKTHASRRTIKMPSKLLDMLRQRYKTRRGDLVFPTIDGTPRDPNNVERALREERDAMKFPGVTSHSLRKCVATMLDSAGMSARDIADYLGHSRVSVTQDIYMQRNRDSAKTAACLDASLAALG